MAQKAVLPLKIPVSTKEKTARDKTPALLLSELIQVARKNHYINGDNSFYPAKLKEMEQIWEKHFTDIGTKFPTDKTIDKFFGGKGSHAYNIIDGFCWVLLGKSYDTWLKENPPSSRFAGLWLAKFTTLGEQDVSYTQYTLESLRKIHENTLKGSSILTIADTEHILEHQMSAAIYYENCLIGIWWHPRMQDAGCFKFQANSMANIMQGKYLINSITLPIQKGCCTWIKVNSSPNRSKLRNHKLKSLDELNAAFPEWLNSTNPIELSAILA